MAKRNPAKALKSFKEEYDGVKEIVDARLGKHGEIIVSSNGKVTIPKLYHNVPVSVLKMRRAS